MLKALKKESTENLAKNLAEKVSNLSSKEIIEGKKVFIDAFCDGFALRQTLATDKGDMPLFSTKLALKSYLRTKKENTTVLSVLSGLHSKGSSTAQFAGGGLVFGLGMTGAVAGVLAAVPTGGASLAISALGLTTAVAGGGVSVLGGSALLGKTVLSKVHSSASFYKTRKEHNQERLSNNVIRNTNLYLLSLHTTKAAYLLADAFEYQITCLPSSDEIKTLAYGAVERAWVSFGAEVKRIIAEKNKKADETIDIAITAGSIIKGILNPEIKTGNKDRVTTREAGLSWSIDKLFTKAGVVDRQIAVVKVKGGDEFKDTVKYYTQKGQKPKKYGYRTSLFIMPDKDIKDSIPKAGDMVESEAKGPHSHYSPYSVEVQADFIHSFLLDAKTSENINAYLKRRLDLKGDDREVQVTFRGNLSISNIPNNQFKNLDGYNFDGADFSYSVLNDGKLGCSAKQASFNECLLLGTVFKRADLLGSSFKKSLLVLSDFSGSDFNETDFNSSVLLASDMSNASFYYNTIMDNCTLQNLVFAKSKYYQDGRDKKGVECSVAELTQSKKLLRLFTITKETVEKYQGFSRLLDEFRLTQIKTKKSLNQSIDELLKVMISFQKGNEKERKLLKEKISYAIINLEGKTTQNEKNIKVLKLKVGEHDNKFKQKDSESQNQRMKLSLLEKQVIFMKNTFKLSDTEAVTHKKSPNKALLVGDIKKRLRKHYEELSKWERFDGTTAAFNLTDNFVNVAIVREEEQRKREERHDQKQSNKGLDEGEGNKPAQEFKERRLNSWEDILRAKSVIPLSEMFSPLKEDSTNKQSEVSSVAPTQLTVLGRAGIGKTTFTRYLGYKCMVAEDKSQRLWPDKFDLVFVLPLRLLSTLDLESLKERRDKFCKRDVTLAELACLEFIYAICLGGNNKTAKDRRKDSLYRESYRLLEIILEEKKDNILYVLDGYDEAVSLTKGNKTLKLALDELLSQKHLIVTSRPYSRPELKGDKDKHRVLEHIGFQEADVKSYIKRYFKDALKQSELLEAFLQKNPSIKGISHIPIQLELLCHAWQERLKTDKPFSNQLGMTELYNELLHNQIQVGLERLSGDSKHSKLFTELLDIDKSEWKSYSLTEKKQELQELGRDLKLEACHLLIQFLGYLAYQAMTAENIPVLIKSSMVAGALKSFNNKHKTKIDLKTILKLGWLKNVGDNSLVNQDYYFLHLTFQEYFAARYLASLLSSDDHKALCVARNFMAKNKYNSQHEVMMWFTAGVLRDDSEDEHKGLKRFWQLYLAEPRDLTGIRHRYLMMRCLEECWQDKPWDETQCDIISRQLTVWVSDKLIKRYGYSYTVESRELINRWLSQLSYTPKVFKGLYESRLQKTLANQEISNDFKIKLINFFVIYADCSKAWVSKNLLPLFEDRYARRSAIEIFTIWLKLGGKLSEKVLSDILLPLLEDKDRDVCESAVQAFTVWLIQGGKVSEKLVLDIILPLFKESWGHVLESAKQAFIAWLIQSGKVSEKAVIDTLLLLLKDEDSNVRYSVVQAFTVWLAQGGKVSEKTVVHTLLPLLKDKYWCVRRSAQHAFTTWLVQGGKVSEKIVIDRLNDENEYVRYNALHTFTAWLAQGGKVLKKAVIDTLLPLFEDKGVRVRYSAIQALIVWLEQDGKVSEKAVIDTLLLLLKDEDSNVRDSAIQAFTVWLEQGGKVSEKTVLDTLLPLLKDEDWSGRKSAQQAFTTWLVQGGKVSEKTVAHILLPLLKDKYSNVYDDSAVQVFTAWLVQGEKVSEKFAIDTLLPLLKDQDSLVRERAIKVFTAWLIQGGEDSEKVVINALLPLLKDQDWSVRYRAAQAFTAWLAQGGKDSERVVIEVLLPLFEDKNRDVRESARLDFIDWIAKGGQVSEKMVIETLLPLLNYADRDTYVVFNGKKFSEKLWALLPLREEEDKNVCKSARRAFIAWLVHQVGQFSKKAVIDALLSLLRSEGRVDKALTAWLRKNNLGVDFYSKKEVLPLLIEKASCLYIQESTNPHPIWQSSVNVHCYTLTFSSESLGDHSLTVTKEQKKIIEDYFKEHALLNKYEGEKNKKQSELRCSIVVPKNETVM